MEKEQPQIDVLKKYANLMVSRRRLIAACILLALSVGLVLYLNEPKIYESSASIVYQKQRINPSEFSPDEAKQMREMVNTISQQVLSRGNLENMIKEYDLYQNSENTEDQADLIERARSSIDVSMEKDRGNVFSVSFQDMDPSRAMQVTDWLASKFIEENLRIREERARETSSYIQDELRMAKAHLDAKETEMKEYKLEHYNEMPGQRGANLNRLNALQEQFQATQTNIYNLEQTRMALSEQLEARRNLLEQNAAGAGGNGGPAGELAEARNRLQELLVRYTPEHPEVKRQKQRISNLEAEMRSSAGSGQEEGDAALLSRQDSRLNDLASRIREIDINLKTLRKESNNILAKIRQYQEWVEAAPIREAEWSALTRDYEELKEYHDKLLSRSFGAEAAETMEVRQKGSQFKIVDSAFLPNTPMKGSFLKILAASLAIGLAAGCGLAMGMDFMNASFKEVSEVENELQLPVTCALPLIVTEAEQKRTKLRNAAWTAILSAWLIALVIAGVHLWLQGEVII
ncbi:MAG: hypothetical protein K9K82_00645 [Desulfobacteraceae bacterium]|nr:hypothetical protein [Desulfobacteraceae bacterium]